jgi:hypothetical protein
MLHSRKAEGLHRPINRMRLLRRMGCTCDPGTLSMETGSALLARLEAERADVFYVKTPVEFGAAGASSGAHR